MEKIESKELSDYVASTIDSIEKGLANRNYELASRIKFELAVVNTARAEGGLRIFVANASGKLDKEIVSKITFEISKKIDASNVRPPIFFGKT